MRMRTQRNDLVLKISRQEAEIYKKLESTSGIQVTNYLKQLKDLAEEKDLLQKKYPIWPFPTAILQKAALATIPAILSVIVGFINFCKLLVQGLPGGK